MRTKISTKILALSLLATASAFEGHAQCATLSSAVADVTLQCGPGGTGNRSGVAYYPTKNTYYSVNAGSPNYPIETFAGTGGAVINSSLQAADYRGLWYNPILAVIEGNTFSGGGIVSHTIDPVTGFADNTIVNMAPSTMPNSQSCGVYDPNGDQVLYYDAGNIYMYDYSTGNLNGSVAITGLPAGSNINNYGIGYTGISSSEVCIYDYSNQAVYFIDYGTGAYTGMCQLPASAPAPASFKMGYTNNRIFLFDDVTLRWYGYKVTNQPDMTFTGNNIYCGTGTNTITASGGISYMWSTFDMTPSISVSPATTTVYIAVVTNAAGCTDATTYMVTVNPPLVVNAATSNTLFCNSGTATLTASGASSYTWSTGPTTATTTVAPSVSTTYTVVGSMAGCSNTAAVSILVESDPIVNVVASSPTICSGSSATLTASGASTYTWSNGPATGSVITVSPTSYTGYTVTGASANGCTGFANVDTISVGVSPNPTVSASANSTICAGSSVTLTALGANNYTWASNGPPVMATTNTLVVTPGVSNTYTVVGSSFAGCRGPNNMTVVAVTVDACTGLIENHASEAVLSAYPNPNNGTFTLKSTTKANLSLVNSLGQMIQTIHLEESNGYTGEVSGLADGIYFIVSPQGANTNTKKIVVTH